MPRNVRALTLDRNPEQLFTEWQKEGRIPKQYRSWQHLESDFNSRVAGGEKEPAAREAMGVTYRNIDGEPILQTNEASDGSKRGINKRAIRVDFNVAAEQHLRETRGQDAVEAQKLKIKNDWQKLAKFEAQQYGKDFGKQFHRGHVVAGLEGGSLAHENMWPEHGARNVAHGSKPRLPMDIINDLYIPRDDMFNIYEQILAKEGLGRSRINDGLMIAADEAMVDLSDRDLIRRGYPEYMRNDNVGLKPETLEATQNRLDDLAKQGISPAAINAYAANLSGTLSRGNSVKQSGPVRVVKPARPTVKVVSPESRRPEVRRALPSTNLGARLSIPVPVNRIGKPQAKPAAKPKPKPSSKLKAGTGSQPSQPSSRNQLQRLMDLGPEVDMIPFGRAGQIGIRTI